MEGGEVEKGTKMVEHKDLKPAVLKKKEDWKTERRRVGKEVRQAKKIHT